MALWRRGIPEDTDLQDLSTFELRLLATFGVHPLGFRSMMGQDLWHEAVADAVGINKNNLSKLKAAISKLRGLEIIHASAEEAGFQALKLRLPNAERYLELAQNNGIEPFPAWGRRNPGRFRRDVWLNSETLSDDAQKLLVSIVNLPKSQSSESLTRQAQAMLQSKPDDINESLSGLQAADLVQRHQRLIKHFREEFGEQGFESTLDTLVENGCIELDVEDQIKVTELGSQHAQALSEYGIKPYDGGGNGFDGVNGPSPDGPPSPLIDPPEEIRNGHDEISAAGSSSAVSSPYCAGTPQVGGEQSPSAGRRRQPAHGPHGLGTYCGGSDDKGRRPTASGLQQ